jgi:hypothetical protein
MLKSLLFSVSLLFIAISFSKSIDFGATNYEIVSDHYQESIEDGYFLIRGVVKDNRTLNPIIGATATTVTMSPQSFTDIGGVFNLKVPLKDSVIYCYASGYSEVQIQGPFKNRHIIQVRIFLMEQQNVVFKPVIYAYNCDQDIQLSLKPKGHFTFTYPQTADGSWSVKTNADGTLTNELDAKKYPYLFWEAEQTGLKIIAEQNQADGYLIQTDTCISFLENTLTAYGLNEKEATDFITFWGPKMIEKPYALIQFLPTETYASNIAELTITPQPETLLRLYMYLMPLDKKELPFELISPEIESVNRKGFTIIEWGGSILPQTQLRHL